MSQASCGVVQAVHSLAYKRRQIIDRHLKRANNRINASQVSAVVFMNDSRIHTVHTIFKDYLGNPETALAHARHHQGNDPSLSRDGEMYLIDQLENFFRTYIPNVLNISGRETFEFKIEIIGPQGTCEDCQEALRRFLYGLGVRYPSLNDETPIEFKINTRWVHGRARESAGNNVGSAREAKGMSWYYGHRRAVRKRWRKRLPHWKLRIRTPDPRDLSNRHLVDAVRVPLAEYLRRPLKGRHIIFE